MNFEKCKQTYQNDPIFYHLVKNLQHFITEMKLSGSEVRDAAMFAVYLHELYNPEPQPIFPLKDLK